VEPELSDLFLAAAQELGHSAFVLRVDLPLEMACLRLLLLLCFASERRPK
jgi:hypothetical protein